MEETYRGGTISANGKRAVIAFWSGWDLPGKWIVDFYRDETLYETVTRAEEDTTPEEVVTSALAFVGYDEMALEKDMDFLAASRKKIQDETDRLSALCAQEASFKSIFDQLQKVNNMASETCDLCFPIESHIAVYRAVRQVDNRL